MSTPRRHLIMTTNNGYDTVLLTEGARVLSQWAVGGGKVLKDYLNTGHRPEGWEAQEPEGLRIGLSERGRRMRVSDFGEPCGIDGTIYDAGRRAFWLGQRAGYPDEED